MRLAVFLFILLVTVCIPPAGSTLYPLFSQTTAGNMSGEQYNDRSTYIAYIATTTTDMEFKMENTSAGGPFSFHLRFAKKSVPDVTVYYLSLYAIQTVKIGTTTVDNPITLSSSNTPTKFDYYKTISLSDFESTGIPNPSNNINNCNSDLSFTTKISFHFVSTDVEAPVTYLRVDCTIRFKRPACVQNSLTSLQTTMLTNSIAEVTIDVSIDAILEACTKENNYPTLDYTSCNPITDGSKQSFALNSPAKFQLSLNDNDLKSLYYLTKFKVTLQSPTMVAPVDFTLMALQPNKYKGKMIFSLVMSIVGDPITITASATMSATISRRILSYAEGTKAAVSMLTGSVENSSKTKIIPVTGSNGLILSIWLISLGILVIII